MFEPTIVSGDEAKAKGIEDLFIQLDSNPQGLTNAEAEARLALYGPDSLDD
jgi:hypothetical protein